MNIIPCVIRAESKRQLTAIVTNRATRLLSVSLLLLLTLPAVAQAQFAYITNNGTITITKYSGPGGSVAIPSTINSLPVTDIGNNAFRDCLRVTSVTIPDSVITIGYAAFKTCGLINITIGTNVTSLGENAFAECLHLTSVTIPDSVITIGFAAFDNCSGLTDITIGTNVTNIANNAFHGCRNLSGITIPNSVTSIGGYSFLSCWSLASVTIGNGITSIGNNAFYGCFSLTSVYFLGNAPSPGIYPFVGVPGTVYYLPGTTGWGTTFGGLPAVMLAAPKVTCSVQQPVLWPPNHKLVNIGLTVTALDYVSRPVPATIQVFCNQNVRDAVSISADTLWLRAEQTGNAKDGRVYLILAKATDSLGVGFASCTVVVPHDASPRSTSAVNAMAADAKAFCNSNNGTAPPDYFPIATSSK